MSRKILTQILSDLEKVSADIQLQLPTGEKAIARQVRQIHTAQQHLKQINQTVNSLFESDYTTLRQRYQVLSLTIAGFIREADNMIMLAEEFPLDPMGATICLHHVNRRKAVLIQQIEQLKSTNSTVSDFTRTNQSA